MYLLVDLLDRVSYTKSASLYEITWSFRPTPQWLRKTKLLMSWQRTANEVAITVKYHNLPLPGDRRPSWPMMTYFVNTSLRRNNVLCSVKWFDCMDIFELYDLNDTYLSFSSPRVLFPLNLHFFLTYFK